MEKRGQELFDAYFSGLEVTSVFEVALQLLDLELKLFDSRLVMTVRGDPS